jgi:hypothetical protein
MKRWIAPGAVALAAVALLGYRTVRTPHLLAQNGAPSARMALRITFGEKQRVTDYSGRIALSDGRVVELIPFPAVLVPEVSE